MNEFVTIEDAVLVGVEPEEAVGGSGGIWLAGEEFFGGELVIVLFCVPRRRENFSIG